MSKIINFIMRHKGHSSFRADNPVMGIKGIVCFQCQDLIEVDVKDFDIQMAKIKRLNVME